MSIKSVLVKIKNFIFPPKTIEGRRTLTEDDVGALQKDLEYERGAKEGKIANLEQANKKLQEQLTKGKELNIAKFLNKQDKLMRYKNYANAFSLKKFFSVAGGLGKQFKILSYDAKTEFGVLDDIMITTEGKIVITYKNGKSKFAEPLISGRDVKQIFWNFGGLSNTASLGYFTINYDAKGRYVENYLEQEIPAVVTDMNGKFFITELHQKKFIDQITGLKEDLNKLYELNETYEIALNNLITKDNLTKLKKKVQEKRAGVLASSLSLDKHKQIEIENTVMEMGREIASRSYMQGLSESKIDKLEEVREEMNGQLRDFFTKQGVDVAEENFQRLLDFVTRMAGRVQKQQPYIDETIPKDIRKTDLEKKFGG